MSDTTAPSLVSTFPGGDSTDVGLYAPVVLTFDEALSGSVVATYTRPDGSTGTLTGYIQNNQLIFDDLMSAVGVNRIDIAAGQIKDLSGNAVSTPISLSFTVGGGTDTTAPYLVAFRDPYPSDTQQSLTVNAWPWFDFSEALNRGTGTIELRSANGTVLQSYDVSQSLGPVAIAGSRVMLQQLQDIAPGTDYSIYFPAGAFLDIAGNPSAALTWSFHTAGAADTTGPTIVSSTPASGGTANLATDLSFTFSEPVILETGSVKIVRSSDNKVISTLDVTKGTLSGDGKTLTLVTNVPLEPSAGYYIQVDPGVVKDPSGNQFAGLQSSSDLLFTTTTLAAIPGTIGGIDITSDAILPAGATVFGKANGAYNDEYLFGIYVPGSGVPSMSVFNDGTISVQSHVDGVTAAVYVEYVVANSVSPKAYFVNHGLIEATASTTSITPDLYPVAIGVYGGGPPSLFNAADGTISASGDRAYGIYANGGYPIDNAGTIEALGNDKAIGLYFLQNMSTGTINNSGTILASGASGDTTIAMDFVIGGFNTIINSGSITAVAAADASASIGIQYNSMTNQTIINHGAITAGVAIDAHMVGNINLSTTIQNDGTITGDITLGYDNDTIVNTGTITGTITLGGKTSSGYLYPDNNTFDGSLGSFTGTIYCGTGDDVIKTGAGASTIYAGLGNDTIVGGANIHTVVLSGNRSAYTVTQTSAGVFKVAGSTSTDTLTNIQYLQFSDQTLHLLPGTGVSINWNADPSTYMGNIRDFDGNDLGGGSSWKLIGTAVVNSSGQSEHIFFNRQIGRWAEVGTEADGKTYFDDHGWAGDTRVVGIYIDPLVANGTVVKGSDVDSQRRFQNDLQIDNIHGILGDGDYNHDGLQEVYFSLTDGTAYLHAYMWADGNIQYANYQSKQQVIDYLTSNGWSSSTWSSWFPASQTPLLAAPGG